MGLSIQAISLIMKQLKEAGKEPHGKLIIFGRQRMGFDANDFNNMAEKLNIPGRIHDDSEKQVLYDNLVFEALGFDTVDSMDNSDYEGASVIHDLNNPNISPELENKFDFVLDAGTVEHVFHFPNALEVVFKLLKEGGSYIFVSPAFYGLSHGYYNFSPLVYYEYFKANSYEINSLEVAANSGSFVYSADLLRVNDINNEIPYIPDFWVWGEKLHGTNIYGMVTKKSNSTYNAIPYQTMYDNAWKKKEHRIKIRDEVFKSAKDNSIFLYGTGAHTSDFIAQLPSARLNEYLSKIKGLLDGNSKNIGKVFYTYTVYDLNAVAPGDTVIISSFEFQEEIYNRIRHIEEKGVKVVKLYPTVNKE